MMNVLLRERDFRKEVIVTSLIVRVFAIKRDCAFVGKENLPNKDTLDLIAQGIYVMGTLTISYNQRCPQAMALRPFPMF